MLFTTACDLNATEDTAFVADAAVKHGLPQLGVQGSCQPTKKPVTAAEAQEIAEALLLSAKGAASAYDEHDFYAYHTDKFPMPSPRDTPPKVVTYFQEKVANLTAATGSLEVHCHEASAVTTLVVGEERYLLAWGDPAHASEAVGLNLQQYTPFTPGAGTGTWILFAHRRQLGGETLNDTVTINRSRSAPK